MLNLSKYLFLLVHFLHCKKHKQMEGIEGIQFLYCIFKNKGLNLLSFLYFNFIII